MGLPFASGQLEGAGAEILRKALGLSRTLFKVPLVDGLF